jgi:hypothetical protein
MPEDQSWQKQLAMQWKRAAPFLAAQRRRDIRRQNNARAMEHLEWFFSQAIKNKKPSRSSGFVQMHQILRRSRI